MRSTKTYARIRCGGNLHLCLAFGTGVLGVLWWLGSWVVGIRYRKQAFTVRNMRAVLKKASWGTRRIFGSIRCKKQASTVQKRYSVHENPLFLHGRRFHGPPVHESPLLPHRTHLQCAKRPRSLCSLRRPPSPAPSTALGTRNGPARRRADIKKG